MVDLEACLSALSKGIVDIAPASAVEAWHGLLQHQARLDASLASVPASKVIVVTLACCWLGRFLSNVADVMLDQGVLQSVLNALKRLPGISHVVRREKEKLSSKIQKQVHAERYEHSKVPKFSRIPAKAMTHKQVMQTIADLESKDEVFDDGKSKMSGAVYFNSADHANFQTQVYSKFVRANPLHADSYPSVVRMDAELVAMTASLFSDPEGDSPPCGSVTSGGSESILCAMKASRDWWLSRKGYGVVRNLVRALPWLPGSAGRPEMIIADSAHAAYIKAAEYYNIKMVVVRVGERTGFRLTAAAVRRRVTRNTAIVVCSAPSYPHGVCDDIEGIGKLAKSRGIAMHVDACLGGFVLPFAEEAGFERPKINFGLAGVTSMSVDTHKYAMAHKGTSVVLYRGKDIRKFQFTSVTDWSGGLYISPTMAGSRSGAVVAAAWASLLAVGREGFVAQARHLLTLAERLAARIDKEMGEDLRLLGWPDTSVVAWGSRDQKAVDVFKVLDAMKKKGWALSALQHPPGIHMCLTSAHSKETIDSLVRDLAVAVEEAKRAPKDGAEGMAPIYGMAESLPDRGIVGDVLVAFQESSLDC